ncbi:Uncharacterised protein [[Clostridium] sordellii]|uniref:glycosyltransferase n=1 Tax=Paraclostridium sordellii TaxID=1505 RepID=UPI0005E7CC76|nr:glycosyltransferase [Paeniclostridium sordellii]CEN23763.1 Uncharacterised protein [[Clostridium] sordellii] [Paeniclostridium sordellii]
MDKIIFIRNKNYRPSSYYRVCQYMTESNCKLIGYEPDIFYKIKKKNKLHKNLINIVMQFIPGYTNRIINILKIIIKNKFGSYNLYVQRAVFPKFIGPIGKLLYIVLVKKSNKIFWDFDDNIIESGEVTSFEKDLLEKNSYKIIVGNEFLKSRLNQLCYSKVDLIPTTDKSMEKTNLGELNNKRMSNYDKEIIIVWVGTFSNLKFVYKVADYLDRAALNLLELHSKKLILNIVCDQPLEYNFQHITLNNINWEREVALKNMERAHIGIMPLEEDFYTPGKCGFKAVQTIGLGIPTIVSPVGFNKEVIENLYNGYYASTKEQWIESIMKLSTDKEIWLELSKNSRKKWEEKFNSRDIENYLFEMIGIEKAGSKYDGKEYNSYNNNL